MLLEDGFKCPEEDTACWEEFPDGIMCHEEDMECWEAYEGSRHHCAEDDFEC